MIPLIRALEEASLSGELNLSSRKLKEFPYTGKYDLTDTVKADLSKNRFIEIPSEVTKFWFLEELDLSYNVIRLISTNVTCLQSLIYLNLSHNQLPILPGCIFQLPQLEILLLSHNKLQTLPLEVGLCKTLMKLDISCNQINNLPVQFGKLLVLKHLNIRSNVLLELPLELTSLRLIHLDISRNKISTLPVEIGNLSSLEVLNVADNPLIAPPASVCSRGRIHIFKWLELRSKEKYHKKDTTRQNGGQLKQRSPDIWKNNNYNKIDLDAKKKSFLNPMTINPDSATVVQKSSIFTKPISSRSCSISSTDSADFIATGYESANNISHMQTYKEYKESLKQQRNIDTVYKSRQDGGETATADTKIPNCSDNKLLHSPPPSVATPLMPESKSNINNFVAASGTSQIKHEIQITKVAKSLDTNSAVLISKIVNATVSSTKLSNGKILPKTIPAWNQSGLKPQFTMRREFEKAREEAELIKQLKSDIETYLKMVLPDNLSSALSDGIVLCHLANYVRPHTVSSIHVPSPTVPKLTLARCRKNVDNFIHACKKIGVSENLLCSQQDILEGKGGIVRVAITVSELMRIHNATKPSSTDVI